MEVQRQAGARSRKSSVRMYVRIDRFLRALGLPAGQESSLAALSAETRSRLQAYANGVNAYLKKQAGALSPEFLHPRRHAGSLEASEYRGDRQIVGAATASQLQNRNDPRRTGAKTAAGSGSRFPHPATILRLRPNRRSCSNILASLQTSNSCAGCREDMARPTNGRLPARAPPASRFSPTIRISISARRSCGISRASSRLWDSSKAPRCQAGPTILLGQNDAITWVSPTPTPTCRDLSLKPSIRSIPGYT